MWMAEILMLASTWIGVAGFGLMFVEELRR